MTVYSTLTVETRARDAELAQALLHLHDPLGLELRTSQAGVEMTVAYYAEINDALAAKARVLAALPSAHVEVSQLADRDWANGQRLVRKPLIAGRLCVVPPGEARRVPPGKIPILLPRREAFGSEGHPTTWLGLDALDTYLAGRPGASVLDVGTGSGVLAIAAKKLGAGEVIGIDIRANAINEARENAELNGVGSLVFSQTPLADVPGRFDLVVINMLSSLSLPLAPELAARTGGTLVVSGLVTQEWEKVEAAFVATGLRSTAIFGLDVWVRLIFERQRRRQPGRRKVRRRRPR